jgi:hypothetical protein
MGYIKWNLFAVMEANDFFINNIYKIIYI